jgi:predicted ATPase
MRPSGVTARLSLRSPALSPLSHACSRAPATHRVAITHHLRASVTNNVSRPLSGPTSDTVCATQRTTLQTYAMEQQGGGANLLTGLRLESFKSWDDTGPVRLAPFTVFFGRNSSGKSTLLQAMLLMKQTAESLDPRQVLNLGDADALVDLGTYQDVVFGHATERDIRLSFDWKVDNPVELRTEPAAPLVSDSFSFTTKIGIEHGTRRLQELVVKEMDYLIGTRRSPRVGMRRRVDGRSYQLITDDKIMGSRSGADDVLLPAPVKCFAFPDVAFKAFRDADMLAELSHQFDELMSSISYVGPLRSRPSRSYQWRGSRPSNVGPSGENTVAALLARSGHAFMNGPGAAYSDFHSMIGFWLRQMGVIDEFEITEIADGTDLYELRVTAPGSTTPVSILDVGFGVSQVLPVLVQSFYADPESAVILEQPEIHLHPAAQSELGDALIAAVKENGTQLIVETHSEHLLHRIQLRIAQEKITADEVALYFIETSGGRSEIRELEIDDYGNITNWPQDFFGDEIGDLAAMTEAAAERRGRRL